jgi:hypothetical protein
MRGPLPSLELTREEARAERERHVRFADAIDTKAGIVLGFAGAIVAIAATAFDIEFIPAVGFAVLAALQCLWVHLPDRYPAWELRAMRDRYLRADDVCTRLHLLDTEIAMVELQARIMRRNARLLKLAIGLLFCSVVALVVGTLVRDIGG